MYFVLSAFTSSPISLVATTKASAFSFTVCRMPPNMLTSSALTENKNFTHPLCSLLSVIIKIAELPNRHLEKKPQQQ
jgi:hypothetical protein